MQAVDEGHGREARIHRASDLIKKEAGDRARRVNQASERMENVLHGRVFLKSNQKQDPSH